MQLFIVESCYKDNDLLIVKNNKDLLNQLRKVLRAKAWYHCYFQSLKDNRRYFVTLTDFNNIDINCEILEEIHAPIEFKKSWMLVALPNKWEKLELIVQKLTEIWITDILFWKAERSVLTDISDCKMERLYKIMREAVEQSWWWMVPNISICHDIHDLFDSWDAVVFDISDWNCIKNLRSNSSSLRPYLWIIWPEWWLSDVDYANFPENRMLLSLWNTVLRMETAAIVWWWVVKNWFSY